MFKSFSHLIVLLLVSIITACGSSSTSTTALVAVYGLPTSLATTSVNMGGSVQGTNPTLAGSTTPFAGTAGSYGLLDGTGTEAKFNRPTDITTDGSNFYVADYANSAIREITPTGVVTTLAFTSDGTTTTYFSLPFSISVDGTNIYVVDAGTNTVRIINKGTNIVTTIGSTSGLSGSVDSTTPADVRFYLPTGITTDGENVYIADSGNHTIRRIDLSDNSVTTMAGASGSTGSTDGNPEDARFNLPARITTDGTSLYVTDFNNRTIRKIDILTGVVSTIAGAPGVFTTAVDGTGTAARFNQPNGITTDGTNLYVTDSYLNTIRRIVISSGEVSTITLPENSLHTPMGLTVYGGKLYVADTYTVEVDSKYKETYTYSNSIIEIQ